MAIRVQQRRGTADQWLASDPVLAAGEIGFETDTSSFKIGDGVNSWVSLEYFTNESGLTASLEEYINVDQLGIPLGVATLDENGFVDATQLDIDLTAYYTSVETDSAIATAVSGIIDAAPGALDTLNELAAAIGDDANFITTIGTDISDAEQAAKDYADGLATNYDAAGSASAAQSAAETFATDADTALYGTVTSDIASAKSEAIFFAASDATTKADAAESDANTYTDDLIGDATVDGTAGNTVKDRINSAVSGLVDTAPATLDTLNELAAALNDDASFATTVTNSLAEKAPIASPSFTGTVDFSNSTVQGIEIPQPIHAFTMIG